MARGFERLEHTCRANAAFAELQQLRERLLGNSANNMTSAQITAALREVRQRYEVALKASYRK